jgi:hypothetical protein
MSLALEGIPISEEQCIGESLPYINSAFETLCSSIVTLSSFDILTAEQDLSNIQSYMALLSARINLPLQNQTNYGIGIKAPPSVFDLTVTNSSISTLSSFKIFSTNLVVDSLTGTKTANFNTLDANTINAENGLTAQKLVHFFDANVGINTTPGLEESLNIYGNCYIDGRVFIRRLSAEEFNIGIGDVATTGRIVAVGATEQSFIGYDKETPSSDESPAAVGNIGSSPSWDGETTIHSYCGKIVLPNNFSITHSLENGSTGFVKTYKVFNAYVKNTDVVNLAVSKIGNSPEQGFYAIPFLVRIEDGYFVFGIHTVFRYISTKIVDKTTTNPLTINFAIIRVPEV